MVGPVDSAILAPKDFSFEDYRLSVRWKCFKKNILIKHIAPTGSTDCGKRKNGEVIVPIASDGTFSLPKISERRWSPFSDSRYWVEVTVLHGDREGESGRDVLFNQKPVDQEIDRSLEALHLARFSGGSTPVDLVVRLNRNERPVEEFLAEYPNADEYPQARCEYRPSLEVVLPEWDHRVWCDADFTENGLEIDGRDLVTVNPRFGAPLRFELSLNFQCWVWEKENEPAVFHSCLRLERKVEIGFSEENVIPADLLDPIEMVLDLDEPTQCWTF